jgi:hypothetical protein
MPRGPIHGDTLIFSYNKGAVMEFLHLLVNTMGMGNLLCRKSGVVYRHPNLLPQKKIYRHLHHSFKVLLDAKSKLSLSGVGSFDSQPKNTTDIIQEIKHFPAIQNQDTAGWC